MKRFLLIMAFVVAFSISDALTQESGSQDTRSHFEKRMEKKTVKHMTKTEAKALKNKIKAAGFTKAQAEVINDLADRLTEKE